MGSSGTGALTSSAKGRLIQITLPSQGYLNPLESYLRFDLCLTASSATQYLAPRNLNSIHSMFRRLRILYGSMVVEDIQLYGAVVRTLTNVAVEAEYQSGVGAITEGMGSDAARGMIWEGVYRGDTSVSSGDVAQGGAGAAGNLVYETRKLDGTTFDTTVAAAAASINPGPGRVIITKSTGLGPNADLKHTFTIQLASGLLTQQKLIPLKWMANQLTIELELEEPSMFLVQGVSAAGQSTVTAGTVGPAPALSDEVVPAAYSDFPAGGVAATNGYIIAAHNATGDGSKVGYYLDNINYVAEILEFDSTYDAAFFQGMASGGVPIKFSSWHTHQHVLNGSTTVLTIQERARSIKSAFSIIRFRADQDSDSLRKDPYWTYPGAPVNISAGAAIPWTEAACALDEFQWRIGGRYFPSQPVKCTNGGAEPLIELQKALNLLGDYSLAPAISPKNWFVPRGVFVISTEFESTNGFEMSGINAEELADLALVLKLQGNGNFSNATTSTVQTMQGQVYATTFVNYDALIIIRPNNIVEMVQ